MRSSAVVEIEGVALTTKLRDKAWVGEAGRRREDVEVVNIAISTSSAIDFFATIQPALTSSVVAK